MKHLLLITIAALLVVGCGPSKSIHQAAYEGNLEAVKQHLAAGANVNAKEVEFGMTPLHLAANEGHKDVVELLITAGADVHAKDGEGFTPMDHATIWDHKEIADLLVKHGGKSGAGDSIHVAAAVGNIESVKQHLAAGVDAKSDNGGTPLLYAAWIGHKEIVELLIAKGADVNAKSVLGEAPLDRAIRFNRAGIADILRNHGGKTAEELKAEGK